MARIMGDEDDDGACVAHGVLAYALQASRALGLAPLRKTRGGWSYKTTPRQMFYNYLLFLAIHSYIIVTLQQVFIKEWYKHQYHHFAAIEIFVWTVEISRFSSVLIAGVVGVRARMVAVCSSLNDIEKVQVQYKSDRLLKILDRKEKVFVGLVMLYVTFGIGQTLNQIRIDIEQRSMRNFRTLLTFNRTLLLAMLALTVAQFTLTALRANCALRAINDSMGGLLYFIDLHNSRLSAPYSIPVTSINVAVDSLKVEKQINRKAPQSNIDIGGSIHHLTMAYESVQKAVKVLNEGFGFAMLIIYTFFLIYLSLAPYFLLIYIDRNMDMLAIVGKVIEFLIYIILMLWGVQPGHEIEEEVQRTRQAVSELFSRAPSSGDGVNFQLKLFVKQLELGDPSYSPMGIFILRRPLISAIVATTVTFTVVILQIQGLKV